MTKPRGPNDNKLLDKQAEKSRWFANYRREHRQHWQELCEREPRLPVLRRTIRQSPSPAALLVTLSDSWVRHADEDLRFAALRQIDRHANRMARFDGRPVLDDPLPPARNVFLIAREMLAVR